MKKTEIILTNIPRIIEMRSIGGTTKEIAEKINSEYNANFTARDIYNYMYYVRNQMLNKKYNNFVLLDVTEDTSIEFMKTSIIVHGLQITILPIMKYFDYSHMILTPKNFKQKVTTAEGLLYAKRLLKQYWISDKELIDNIKKNNPNEKIDYPSVLENIHNTLSNEVAEWIESIKSKAIEFTNMKGKI